MSRATNTQSSGGVTAGYSEKRAMKLLFYTKKILDKKGIPFFKNRLSNITLLPQNQISQ